MNKEYALYDLKPLSIQAVIVRGDMDALNRIKGHVYRKHGVAGTLTPTGMLKFNL